MRIITIFVEIILFLFHTSNDIFYWLFIFDILFKAWYNWITVLAFLKIKYNAKE